MWFLYHPKKKWNLTLAIMWNKRSSHPTEEFLLGVSFCFHILSSCCFLFFFLVLSFFSSFVQVLYERLGGCYCFSSLILFFFCTKLAKSLVIVLFFGNLLWVLGRFYLLTFYFFLAQKLRNKTLWVWHLVFFFSFLVLKKFDKLAPKDLGSFLSFFYFLFV